LTIARRHQGLFYPRLEALVDEITMNTKENVILKETTNIIVDLFPRLFSDSSELGESLIQDLQFIEDTLKGVSVKSFNMDDIDTIEYGPGNSHYQRSIELAKFILKSVSGGRYGEGTYDLPEFMIDMPLLFQNFVKIQLRNEVTEWKVHQSDTHVQFYEGKKGFPDIKASLKTQPSTIIVGECKYKLKHQSLDYYQLISYVCASNAKMGALIYGSDDSFLVEDISITKGGKKICCAHFLAIATPLKKFMIPLTNLNDAKLAIKELAKEMKKFQ
jgi:5-methylcytosine-specific restriction endonuclease McrBC regulatory subunit McrC